MDPSLVIFLRSPYSTMTSSEISLRLRQMYSGRLSSVMRYKLDMSIVINLAPFVDITLLKISFQNNMSAVGVASSPGLFTWSPLTVNSVLFSPAFSGWMLQTNFPYVTSLIQLFGTSFLRSNLMVLLGFFIRLPIRFSNRPN